MELAFEKENLSKSLQLVQNVAVSRNTLPILSNVLISADSDSITLAATDLEVGIKTKVTGKVLSSGSITVPARKLSDLVRVLPDSEIRLRTLSGDRIEIEYERGLCKINGLSAEEFPAMPSLSNEYFTLDAETVCTMIQKTAFAVSTEETRFFLNGVYFHINPEMTRMVATDGRRLAMATSQSPDSIIEEVGVIIPTKAANELMRIFYKPEAFKISIMENQILFSTEESTLISRLVEGEYPNYQQIIPLDNDIKISTNSKGLLAAINRVSILAPRTLSVRLEVGGDNLKVSASAPDVGEAQEEIKINNEGEREVQTAFNAKFIIDALKNIDTEELIIELKDSLSPAVIKPVGDDNYMCLIMPMRLE